MFMNAPLCLAPICPPNDPSEPHSKCSVLGLASICTYFIVQLALWVFYNWKCISNMAVPNVYWTSEHKLSEGHRIFIAVSQLHLPLLRGLEMTQSPSQLMAVYHQTHFVNYTFPPYIFLSFFFSMICACVTY